MSATSNVAYFRIQLTAGAMRGRILDFAMRRGARGFTADELAADWCCFANHVAPRIGELIRAGKLIVTRERRSTRSGCLARVVVLARFARPVTTSSKRQPELPFIGMENSRRDPA